MSTSKKKITVTRVFLLLIVAIIISSTLMCGFATDWGYVHIQRINLVGDDGLSYSAILMVPKTATNENPAPVFIACHGGSADGRAMETWGLEMARRGYVVMCPDAAGGGSSEKYPVTQRGERYDYVYAPVYTMFKYVTTLPIVQSDNVHLAGISQGGGAPYKLSEDFPDQVKTLCFVATAPIFEYKCNVMYIQGIKDTVCVGGEQGPFIDGWYADLWTEFEDFGITANDQIELDHVYGSYEDGTARVLRMNRMTHAAGTFNHQCISWIVDFVMNSTGIENVPHYIDPDNSCWELREAFGLITFILLMLLVPSTAMMIMQIPFFAKIRQPMPKEIGLKKGVWWFSAIMALVMPIVVYSFKTVSTRRHSNAIWPAYHLNKAVIWLCVLTVFGAAMFLLYHFTWGKKRGGSLATYGLTYAGEKTLNLGLIGRSLLMALGVETFIILVLHTIEAFTGLTPHFWFINYSGIAIHRLRYIPNYWIIYVVAFLMSALSMNVERRLPDTGNETRDTIRAVAINIVLAGGGILLMLLVQWLFGYNAMTEPGVFGTLASLIDHSQFGLFVNIGVAAGINTYLYRKTGTIWSGAFVSSLLITVNAVMNNSI